MSLVLSFPLYKYLTMQPLKGARDFTPKTSLIEAVEKRKTIVKAYPGN